MKIIIITPACNEEKHLADLIKSMINQSFLPSEWIIVDDGSTDNTSNVIQQAAIKYSWIRYLRKEKNNLRAPGQSVIEAFYFGFNQKNILDYDIIMKLDADLILPVNYLDSIKTKFQNNHKTGICGGVCVLNQDGRYEIEKETNLDHVRGAIKAYKRACFEEIGGLLKKMGWDTVDEHHARYKGWLVNVLPDLRVIHQRSTHQEYGFLKASYRNGRMLYSIRMDIFLVIGNSLKKCLQSPFILLGCSMILGYIISWLNRDARIVDQELGRYIRQYRYQQFFKKYLS